MSTTPSNPERPDLDGIQGSAASTSADAKPDPARWTAVALNGDSFNAGFTLGPRPAPSVPPTMRGMIMIP